MVYRAVFGLKDGQSRWVGGIYDLLNSGNSACHANFARYLLRLVLEQDFYGKTM